MSSARSRSQTRQTPAACSDYPGPSGALQHPEAPDIWRGCRKPSWGGRRSADLRGQPGKRLPVLGPLTQAQPAPGRSSPSRHLGLWRARPEAPGDARPLDFLVGPARWECLDPIRPLLSGCFWGQSRGQATTPALQPRVLGGGCSHTGLPIARDPCRGRPPALLSPGAQAWAGPARSRDPCFCPQLCGQAGAERMRPCGETDSGPRPSQSCSRPPPVMAADPPARRDSALAPPGDWGRRTRSGRQPDRPQLRHPRRSSEAHSGSHPPAGQPGRTCPAPWRCSDPLSRHPPLRSAS